MEEKEILNYFKETGLTISDIKELFEKYANLRCAVIEAQHMINDNHNNEISKDDIKMEVFKLWYLAEFEKEYEV